jgi:3-oxoacyl-[acyl-carrier protein] reductase
MNAAREFLPLIKEARGAMLFISSIAGIEAFGAPVDYSVAKTAVLSFAKNIARKLARDHVRVNCIAPGNIFFPGGSWDEKMKANPGQVNDIIKASVPMNRFGTPQEIADAALFLCSERASFITGAVLCIDGGQTVTLF